MLDAGDVGKLFGTDSAWPQNGRPQGVQFLIPDHLMNSVGDDCHPDRRGDVEFTDRLRDLHEAEKAEILGGLHRRGGIGSSQTSQVEEMERSPLRVFDLAEKREVIFGTARVDFARSVGVVVKGLAAPDELRHRAGLSEECLESVIVSVTLRKNEPKDAFLRCRAGEIGGRSGSLPGWDVEPMVQRERAGFGGWPLTHATGSVLRLRFNPVEATLERIGRQRDVPPAAFGVKGFPVDVRSSQPETSDGGEQDFRVRLILVVVTQAGNRQRRDVLWFRGMLLAKDAERPARSRFEQERIFHLPERLQGVVKARGVIDVAPPVGRVGGLGGGDPAAGDIGNKRDARGIEPRAPCALHRQTLVRSDRGGVSGRRGCFARDDGGRHARSGSG